MAEPPADDKTPSRSAIDSAADENEGNAPSTEERNSSPPSSSPQGSQSMLQPETRSPSRTSTESCPSLEGLRARSAVALQPPEQEARSSKLAKDEAGLDLAALPAGLPSTTGAGEGMPNAPRARARVRAPANSLPAAFPPPSRSRRDAPVPGGEGGEGEGDEASSASSQASPELNRSRAAEGMGAQNLGVETSGGDELELSVPSHQEHLTSDGQRYTTYEVVVRMGGRQWSVRKRYSQFDQFRMSLRKQHKEVGSFRFPNKSKFNTFAEHTKERRRTGFDEFLRLVAGLHPRPQEVDVFLAMDEHGAGVRGRSVNRQLAWTSRNVNVSPADAPAGPALGRAWAEAGHSAGGARLAPGSVVGGRPKQGGAVHRVPRFPPLADQGRSEKAAEAAAAAAAAATASRSGPSSIVRQVDLMLRRFLGPDLLSMLCVVAVSAVSIVGVWKVGGRPGIATLVMAVCVGLFIQNWDRGLDLLDTGLELVGLSLERPQPPSPAGHSQTSSHEDRPRAESAAAWLGRSRQPLAGGEGSQ